MELCVSGIIDRLSQNWPDCAIRKNVRPPKVQGFSRRKNALGAVRLLV